MLVLVRLIAPEAYGKFALVNTVIGFIAVVSYNQFLAYIVQVADAGDVHYQDYFTAGAVIALLMFLLTNAVAATFWALPTFREIAPLVHVMSFSFLNAFPCDFRIKMLERELDWKRLRILHAMGLLASSATALAMGISGAGVYALLVPSFLVNVPFTIDLFVARGWRPNWSWSIEALRAAFKFGLARVGSAVAKNGCRLLESAVLATAIGLTGLGFLNRAVGLAQIIGQKFPFQLLYSIYPALTQLGQDAARVRRIHRLVLVFVAWSTIPAAVLFSVLAAPVVLIVYGAKWRPVIEMMPPAMFAGVAAALAQTTNSLLLSRQEPKKCLLADVLLFAGTAAVLVFALPAGVARYLEALGAIYSMLVLLMIYWLRQGGALRFVDVFVIFIPPLLGSGLSYVSCEWLRGRSGMDISHFGNAMLYGLVFLASYCGFLRMALPAQLGQLIGYLPAKGMLNRVLFLPAHAEAK